VIYIQPGTGPSDTNLAPLYALLQSQQVQQAAINEVAKQQLGKVPEDLKAVEIGIIEAVHTANVISYDPRLRADLVLEQLRIQAAVKLSSMDRDKDLLESKYRDQLTRNVEQMQHDLARKRKQLFCLAKQHNVEVDPQIENQRRLQLATERQRLRVEMDGLKARQAVLQRQLAELIAKPMDENALKVIEELGKVIEAKKLGVELLLHANKVPGTVSKLEIEHAKGPIAEAEVELAKFRREISAETNQRAGELRHRLEDTLIDIAETEAKSKRIEELDSFSTQVEDKRLELELDEEQFRRARQELDELVAKRFSYVPPQVILIRTK
jgi:hypothetical protein